MPLIDLKNKINSLNSFDIEQEQRQIFFENSELITDVMAKQMSEGKDKNGIRGDTYRPRTVQIKKEIGKGLGSVTDRVTFFMTGELYASLFAEITAKTVEIKSPLETYDKMIERVSFERFGFSNESANEIREEIIRPKLSVIIKQKLGINL